MLGPLNLSVSYLAEKTAAAPDLQAAPQEEPLGAPRCLPGLQGRLASEEHLGPSAHRLTSRAGAV